MTRRPRGTLSLGARGMCHVDVHKWHVPRVPLQFGHNRESFHLSNHTSMK